MTEFIIWGKPHGKLEKMQMISQTREGFCNTSILSVRAYSLNIRGIFGNHKKQIERIQRIERIGHHKRELDKLDTIRENH